MRLSLVLLAALLLAPTVRAQTAVEGRVVDAETGQGVPFAHVVEGHAGRAVAADAAGRFRMLLPPGRHALRATAVGYAPARAEVEAPARDVVLVLRPVALAAEEVVVEARAPAAADITAPARFDATEDLLARVPGVDLLRRGAYAWEPAVRGLQAAQIGLTIDGMRVYGACVDRMDPPSSYVEPENLERVEVRRGALDLLAAPGVGGALRLVTALPTFGAAPRAEVEAGGATSGWTRRVRAHAEGAHGPLAARVSGSWRAADDYAPAGRAPLPHSGYEKRNAALALGYDLGRGHALYARALADDAWLVGYPALLMDATLARAHLVAAEWRFEEGATEAQTRAYRSRVDHVMDDRFRDVMARDVMRGMYMPMEGHTETWGLVAEGRTAAGAWTFGAAVDLHRTAQFGDMEMISLFPGIPDMYLLNVGDARATNLGVAVRAGRSLGAVTLRADVRLDATARDLHRADARGLFAGRADTTAVRLATAGASLAAEWAAAPGTRLRLGVARAARLPSLVEHYGHYVYDYVDGHFYSGDPALRPETSLQAEAGLDLAGRRHAVRAAVFVNRLANHIAGVDDAGLGGSATYRFRRYAHVGPAWLAGGEASGALQLTDRTEVVASLAYTWGHRTDLEEPLPQIPPLSGVWAVRHRRGAAWAELEGRWALAQNRVAWRAARERPTDGYHVLALRGGAALGRGLAVRAGLENALDAFYREHTAIGQLPSPGRSATLTLTYTLGP